MIDGPGLPSPTAVRRRPIRGRRSAYLFQKLLDWFVPDAYIDAPQLRQQAHLLAGAVLASVPVTFTLGIVAFLIVPPSFSALPWIVLATSGFMLFPLLVRWTGRLELISTLLVQTLTLLLLAIAHYFGALLSPALPWLMIVFTISIYFLAPWPHWRNANLILVAAEIAAFAIVEVDYVTPAPPVGDRYLLTMLLCSSIAVFALMQAILLLVWSMNVAKQRRLRREVDVRKAVEAELRIGREHLARAQAVGRIGSAERDIRSESTKWSSEHYRLLGLAPDTPGEVNELLLQSVHPDDREIVSAILDRERLSALTPAAEFRIVHPDGEVRWLRRQPEFVRDGAGGVASLFVTVQDITDWKRAQEERVTLERQLLQAQKLEAIGKLAGGVAHDFNNLLAVILGRMEMVEEELLDRPELREWVLSAIRAAERGKNLTKMMLSFARRQPLQPSEIDPSAMFREITDMLGRTLGESIHIKLVTATDQWHCEADPGQLQSALLNLAVNARDAMPNGGTLTIATDNIHLDEEAAARIDGAAPGDYVLMSVGDTGIGMRPDVIEHAFEPFFTTKETGRGTGLGLSMVSGFVAQSGGHITISSMVGQGTTVDIYLPRKGRQEAEDRLIEHRSETPRSGRESILVVEDDAEVREMARVQLERLGYRVVTASTGSEGLDCLSRNPDIALLLCDLALAGGMDGGEVAKRAKAMRADLKTVFMSGYSTRIDRRAPHAGETPYLLRKPFHREELAAEIQAALSEE